ncbi:MAG: hypothetical protein ACM3OO_03110 [Planctomycetaceae bacterium]
MTAALVVGGADEVEAGGAVEVGGWAVPAADVHALRASARTSAGHLTPA